MTPAADAKDWFWIVGDDASSAYSSAQQQMVQIASADPDRLTHIDSMESLIGVLRAANVPPYHAVTPYRIVRRLEAAGVAAQAIAVLEAPANAVLRWRFTTLAGVPADDPDARALIAAAGADPDEILAPE